MKPTHAHMLAIVRSLPTDYTPWGTVEHDGQGDCSSGCAHALPLPGKLGMDWVVCARAGGPRAGLLTFEHQAGRGCFELRKRGSRG